LALVWGGGSMSRFRDGCPFRDAAGPVGMSPRIARGPVGTRPAGSRRSGSGSTGLTGRESDEIPLRLAPLEDALACRSASTSLARFSSASFSRCALDKNFGYRRYKQVLADDFAHRDCTSIDS
jgi:hypothetical protein